MNKLQPQTKAPAEGRRGRLRNILRPRVNLSQIGGEGKKQSALLERLSKEKPAHNKDEIDEALRRGYSVKQIIKALTPEMEDAEIRQGKIFYSGVKGAFEIPYTYEAFKMLCQIFFG